MKKIFADILFDAIIITLLTLIALSPVSARPDLTDAKNIIITPPELYEQAKSLKDFHDGNVSTEVVNTTWIYSNYANASDPPYEGYKNHSLPNWSEIQGYNYSLAKRIIKYLDNGTAHPNLKYVTLFGNARLVPPSYYIYILHNSPYENWIPTDFFYASPEYDLFPEYMVGRLPVNNSNEAEHVVQKIISWDGNKSWDWFKNVTLAGGRPSYSAYYKGELIIVDSINRNSFNGMNITKLFKTDGNFTKANVLNALSGDTGMLYIISHGEGDLIRESSYFRPLYVSDLLSLDSNSKAPVVVSSACTCGAFDTNVLYGDFNRSFGEGVLLSNAAGIAYIGGVRVSYFDPSFYLQDGYLMIAKMPYMDGMLAYVFEAYHNGSQTLGNITKTAIEKYVAENNFSNVKYNVTLFEFVLLGDPALELPSQQPGVSYPQPNSTAVNPRGYVGGTYGNIPWYTTNTSITIHSTTDSPKVYTKRIDTITDTTVERREDSTTEGAFDYTFMSSKKTDYLVRTESEDGKEGWLYVTVFLPIYVNETHWWRDGGAFNQSDTPIQHAIYNATAGEPIIIKDGTYTENINVNKPLTIQSENGSANCIIQAANSDDHVFELTASSASISGFTVKNATAPGKAGIYLSSGTGHCTIFNNSVSNNDYGICLISSKNNNITCNWVHANNARGFYLEAESIGNTIKDNNILNNGAMVNEGGWYYNFYNNQSDDVTAEWNYWGTYNEEIIAESIFDSIDDPNMGTVDFIDYLKDPAPCAPIPELPTIILLSIGLLMLAGYSWVRRDKR
jgi:parallel beta-helix repeat protein